MNFIECFEASQPILMEGALGERLKREYNITFDVDIAMASLVYESKGRKALHTIWKEYIDIAKRYNLPFMATTPTRRANCERIANSIYQPEIIQDNVDFLKEIRDKSYIENMFIGGLMGCRGDAYKDDEVLDEYEAFTFHSWQADLFKKAGVDFLFAGIMPALPEAIGMAKTMETTGLPYIISFMIRKNGCLIDGTPISDAMNAIDCKTTNKPICYMTNCVHPNILYEALNQDFNKTDLVKTRFKGIQANTSPLSPEELDGATDLKCSDDKLLADEIIKLNDIIKLIICGGCCGTDQTHLEEIAKRIT